MDKGEFLVNPISGSGESNQKKVWLAVQRETSRPSLPLSPQSAPEIPFSPALGGGTCQPLIFGHFITLIPVLEGSKLTFCKHPGEFLFLYLVSKEQLCPLFFNTRDVSDLSENQFTQRNND
jgi:hypothetical protein